MATYPMNIPSLLPLASGVPDNPANGINAGDPVRDADAIAATYQYKTRKRLSEVNCATVVDVNDAKKRKNEVEGHNFAGPIPPWAAQLQQSVAGIQQSVAALQQSVADLNTDLNESVTEIQESLASLDHKVEIESQRALNRLLTKTSSQITVVIRRADGASPADEGLWFPANVTELEGVHRTQPDDVTALLTFYGLGADQQATRLDRLKQHLGILL